jgi:hypothetical protein
VFFPLHISRAAFLTPVSRVLLAPLIQFFGFIVLIIFVEGRDNEASRSHLSPAFCYIRLCLVQIFSSTPCSQIQPVPPLTCESISAPLTLRLHNASRLARVKNMAMRAQKFHAIMGSSTGCTLKRDKFAEVY